MADRCCQTFFDGSISSRLTRFQTFSSDTIMADDLKAAFRSFKSSKTFTVVALLVLMLGIGASTAVFSVVDAVVLRGLPFDEHDRLVAVGQRHQPGAGSVSRIPVDPSRDPLSALERRTPELHGLGGPAAGLRVDCGDRGRRRHPSRAWRRARRSALAAGHGGLLQGASSAARAWTRTCSRRGSRRPSPRRGVERRPLASALRRGSRDRRTRDSSRRWVVRGHRCHAGGFHLSRRRDASDRSLGSVRCPSRRANSESAEGEHLSSDHRAAEAWRLGAAGPGADGPGCRGTREGASGVEQGLTRSACVRFAITSSAATRNPGC